MVLRQSHSTYETSGSLATDSAIFLLFDFEWVVSLPRIFFLDFCISCHVTLRIAHDHQSLYLLFLPTLSTTGPIHIQPLQGTADSSYFRASLKCKVIAFPQVPALTIDFIQTGLLHSFKREYPSRKQISVQVLTPRTASSKFFFSPFDSRRDWIQTWLYSKCPQH